MAFFFLSGKHLSQAVVDDEFIFLHSYIDVPDLSATTAPNLKLTKHENQRDSHANHAKVLVVVALSQHMSGLALEA